MDIVKVKKSKTFKLDEPIPADLLLLKSEHDGGFCFIETKNLDGETNMKIKKTLPELQNLKNYETLELEIEPPHANLY